MNMTHNPLADAVSPSAALDECLDRQVWGMLTGRQAHLALGGQSAKRIDPRYGPFAAVQDDSAQSAADLAELSRGRGDALWLIEPDPVAPPVGFHVARTASLLQMIADEKPSSEEQLDSDAIALEDRHAEEMSALAAATQPGPWKDLTRLYGPFFGIFRDGRLAAMAGERMLPALGLAEVSGVCTWPEYRGQGLARRLMLHVMAVFRARGDRPYLHTYADNAVAIGLYRKLGFRERRVMTLTVLEPI